MGLPCFSTELSVILSLTICALTEVFSVIRCSRFIPLHPLYRLRLSLADSPNHADLIEFTSTPLAGKPVLRTDRSRRIAPHPVLPRRSYALIPHDSSPQGSGLSPLCSVSLQVALAHASLRAGHEALRQAQGRLLRQAQDKLPASLSLTGYTLSFRFTVLVHGRQDAASPARRDACATTAGPPHPRSFIA